jgi:hypothetical protein
MKIIGESKEGFILEANKHEVANLKGFYSILSTGFTIKVGDDIQIESIYQRYRAFEDLIKSDRFKDALNRLEDTIAVLTPVENLFDQTKEIIK